MEFDIHTIRVIEETPESDVVTLGARSGPDPTKFKVVDGVREARMARIERATTFVGLCNELGRIGYRYMGPDPFEGGFLFQN